MGDFGRHSTRRPFNTQDVDPVHVESDGYKLAAMHDDMIRLIELLNTIDSKTQVLKLNVEHFNKVASTIENTLVRLEGRMATLDEKMTRFVDVVERAYEMRRPIQDAGRWGKVGESLAEQQPATKVAEEEGEYECPECGSGTKGDEDVCPHCGAQFGDGEEVDRASEPPVCKCPDCKANIYDDEKVCPSCGHVFG